MKHPQCLIKRQQEQMYQANAFMNNHTDLNTFIDAWIHFCPCGSTASIWCQKCALRGYCSLPCREKDEKPHNAMCQPNLELLRQSLMDIQKASGSD